MPFTRGNSYGKKNLGRKKDSPKTIWLLQSLAANGVDLQDLLAKSILKAAKGDRQAMDLAHLLTKLLPMVANAPKNDQQVNQIETLVINRYDSTKRIEPERFNDTLTPDSDSPIETTAEGYPPSLTEDSQNKQS